jgi:hypothetical protein
LSNVIYLGTRAATVEGTLLDDPNVNLIGATLRWKRYRGWTASWLPGQCEFCGAQFTEGGAPGLNSGYSVVGGGPAGQDDYLWICAICYDLRRDQFCWTVLDTRGRVCEPRDLLDAALEWRAWPAPAIVKDDADGGG